ncbi:MAG: S26 family signal peptidase [Chloroflexota bacterium]|nr:S26 family signal peptidase [Chloroflexota bacterium]
MLYLLRVTGDSMSPTLEDGHAILALSPRLVAVKPGRIIAFRRGADLYIKRALTREGDGWFVVGDNPTRSTDSRRFGPVPESAIRAVAVLRLAPQTFNLRRLLPI